MSSIRTGSDTFELTVGAETHTITADKGTPPAETAAQVAAATEHLEPTKRAIAIAYGASQQFMWLK